MRCPGPRLRPRVPMPEVETEVVVTRVEHRRPVVPMPGCRPAPRVETEVEPEVELGRPVVPMPGYRPEVVPEVENLQRVPMETEVPEAYSGQGEAYLRAWQPSPPPPPPLREGWGKAARLR